MASILDRYGIKEVADVTFYEIDPNGKPGKPVLFLDTLKVSTIEQTAETADARGGKGNPKLITWDYGKEINVSIEDALFSPKSMAIMFGNGVAGNKGSRLIRKTATIRLTEDSTGTTLKAQNPYFSADIYDALNGSKRTKLYFGDGSAPNGQVTLNNQIEFAGEGSTSTLYDEDGTALVENFTLTNLQSLGRDNLSIDTSGDYKGHKVMFTYWVKATASEIVISGDTFPGTYYVTGDTYARSDVTGKDQFFQFIIPKAKMTAENTITLEAEGDPSVFNMNLTVLRPEDGDMMKLVQYDLNAVTELATILTCDTTLSIKPDDVGFVNVNANGDYSYKVTSSQDTKLKNILITKEAEGLKVKLLKTASSTNKYTINMTGAPEVLGNCTITVS